jgi:hypothetical protein
LEAKVDVVVEFGAEVFAEGDLDVLGIVLRGGVSFPIVYLQGI